MKSWIAASGFVLIICFCNTLPAQTAQDMQDFSAWLYKEKKTSSKKYSASVNNQSITDYIFSSLFLFYKQYVSSQDGNVCTFYPSCSEYGLQSVKKKGPVLGLMNAFDRLERCNGLSREKYHIHTRTHKLYDPID